MAETDEEYYARRLDEETELSQTALAEMEALARKSFSVWLDGQVEAGVLTREEADELLAELS